MTRFLLQRPIAVIMTFIALVGLSVIAWLNRPVALLPDIDVPEMAIRINYANASPEAIESSVLKPMRESLATMQGLADMESVASNESGIVRLRFQYGHRMDLAFVEVNEKIDRLTDRLPNGMSRPSVIRVNYTDIPVAKIQMVPQSADLMSDASIFAENIIKKRIEQIEGISLVDINGLVNQQVSIIPKIRVIEQLNISQEVLIQAIRSANQELGGVIVKDGQYQYYMRMAGRLTGAEDISRIPVKIADNKYVPLSDLAQVIEAEENVKGMHFYNQQRAIVMNVHKQPQAVMTELVPQIEESVEIFKKDYPTIDFHITQDQSAFLKAGISNLQGSLLFGGLFAFGVLFLFMGSLRLPIIMGISLPLSLILSFLFFAIFDLSINIISLSGLALGLGMLIDNAIIVLENISRKREEGLDLLNACIQGVSEVQGALISSVLTTLAVFIPLVFLSGVSGVLFFDQAVSVAIILSVSLLVSFILLPLLYKMFFSNKSNFKKQDSKVFIGISSAFSKSHHWVFGHKALTFILILLLIPAGIITYSLLDTKGLPNITRNEAVLEIHWNEPIDVEENANRVKAILDQYKDQVEFTETDAGIAQYLLNIDNSEIQQSKIYLQFAKDNNKEAVLKSLRDRIKDQYPMANFSTLEAKNAFDMLFDTNENYFEVKWRDPGLKENDAQAVKSVLNDFPVKNYIQGASLDEETSIILRVNQSKLLQYGIGADPLLTQLERALGEFQISELKQFSVITPIVLQAPQNEFRRLIETTSIENSEGANYALSNFIDYQWGTRLKKITSDATGPFFSIAINENEIAKQEEIEQDINQWSIKNELLTTTAGRYFTDKENIRELMFILLISVMLLYFILAAQFESFWQPLIVIFTLPFGIIGAILFLYIGGSSINIMSAIGMVVMLGIMVNDAILKVDTMNRMVRNKDKNTKITLYNGIFEAGKIRLKPILMTSITTLLALSPVLISGGLGAELQKPLVLAVMGGLTIGTFTALYFVPLIYYAVISRKMQ